ncbi:MAG: hypothetical protein DRQ89_14975 [Epsilonproteobacteria bacterium]|nr:MAG: hypothetical protein DRQ89_14975 [Campylobacterota bacterium]
MLEMNLSDTYYLIEEAEGGGHVEPNDIGDGYHPKAYNKGLKKKDLDKAVAKLCTLMQRDKRITSTYSLELQTWWRDHQLADKKKLEHDLQKEKRRHAKQALMDKLTPYERELLDL